MKDDITITPLHQPGSILDPLTEIAREGARQMLAAALRPRQRASLLSSRTNACPMDAIASYGMAPDRNE
jgi:hypothetical protein